MDAAAAAAASRRAKPDRGRPLVPPNYVSLRDLRELRLKEKEEQRRREEEEAAARRVREEQRKRQEEEEAAAKRFVEERRRREEEEKARRARAAAPAPAPAPEMRASSSTSSFRSNERDRGGQRLVVVADRPPPLRRGEVTAVKIDVRGNKGPDGGSANAPPGGGFKGQVSAGMVAGPGEPAKPAAASSRAGKPEEKRKGDASGFQGTTQGTNSAPGELAKVDIASYRGPGRPRHSHQGRKKGLVARSTETAMTSLIGEAVEASPLPVANLENKGKSQPGDRSTETVSASMPGKAARGVKSDNKGKEKPSGGRQASMAPGSDMPDGKKVEASVSEGTASGVSSVSSEQADSDVTSCRMPLKPMYRRKGKKGFDVRSTETATTNVAGKTRDTPSFGGVNLEIKGNKGLIEQGTETALPRMSSKAADASLARGFRSENKGRNEPSGRNAGMPPSTACRDGMKTQPCPANVGSGSQRSNGGQGTTSEEKTEGLQGKQRAEEVKAQSHLAAECSGYLRSSGDQGMIQAAKPEGSREKQRVVEMRTASQLKPRDMRNSGRQWPGDHSRVNFTARQNSMVWMPKAAAAPDCAEVGKFP